MYYLSSWKKSIHLCRNSNNKSVYMKLKNLLLALAFVGFGLTAQAQSVENNASLEERVAQLETKSKVKSFADKYLNLSGYLQAGVSWADNDKTTFYIRRARLSLSGNVAEAKLDYRLQVDMAGTPKICDLYMRYKPFKELGVQLGQFKLPFSLENDLYGLPSLSLSSTLTSPLSWCATIRPSMASQQQAVTSVHRFLVALSTKMAIASSTTTWVFSMAQASTARTTTSLRISSAVSSSSLSRASQYQVLICMARPRSMVATI